MEGIRAKFAAIEDPRHPGYVEHRLVDVLILVMCAVICGLDSLGNIIIFAENNQEFVREKLGVEKIPSKATLARILSMVDGAKVGEIMIDLMREQFGTAGDVVAVDGKAICSTAKAGKARSALQILTAYITSSGVILGQEAIRKKTNEIPTFQQMLNTLDINGKTITADAMHCQRETCVKIIAKKGNYLFGLKENQPSLLENAKLFMSDPVNQDLIERHTTTEKNAGRIEKRICQKIMDLTWLEERTKWPGLQTIFSIERITDVRGTHSDETNYYISNLLLNHNLLLQVFKSL